jgi:16S rRNA (adenine1518-N6/adenine1519-N6)-dimethyltransferase
MDATADGARRLLGGMLMVGTNKSLGQHWLKNRQILDEIADLASEGSACDSAEKTEVETCLEIGPGLGFLTSSLLKRFSKVIAVEFDERLATNLPKSFPGKNLEVINGDILKYDFDKVDGSYAVAGNIPYYITSPIIEKVLTVENLPVRVVLLVQKEVAERILDKKETMLSLFVKNRAKVMAGPVVPRAEFTPPPKVDSQVIVMEPHAPTVADEVFELIGQGFRAPRKKLMHNLAGLKSKDELERIFEELGLSLDARPGDLHLEDWQRLHNKL